MGSKLLDSKCHELAKYFCDDAGITEPDQVDQLAAELRDTVQEFLRLESPDR
jgi:hypothetical protein